MPVDQSDLEPDLESELGRAYLGSEELATARSQLADGHSLRVGGFCGASLALFLSAWGRATESKKVGPVFVLTANQDEADQLLEELETWTTVPVLSSPPWSLSFSPSRSPTAMPTGSDSRFWINWRIDRTRRALS